MKEELIQLLNDFRSELLTLQNLIEEWGKVRETGDKASLISLYRGVPNIHFLVGEYIFRNGVITHRDGTVVHHPDELHINKAEIASLAVLVIQYLYGRYDLLSDLYVAVGGNPTDVVMMFKVGTPPS